MFTHFIITRFNLKKKGWDTTKNKEKVLTESWYEERFELFENYCFSSIKNQTNKNFRWLVYFDISTPEQYKSKIEEYKKEFDNFTPIFIDGMDMYYSSIMKDVGELSSKDYIITSRVDNDDSLHKDYIETVQSLFDKQDYVGVDIIDGYTLLIGKKIRLGLKKHLYNPFISLIEKREDFKTVWHKSHTSWKFERRIIRVENNPLWMSIIHSKNKANKFTGFGNVSIDVLKDFNLKDSTFTYLSDNIEYYSAWKMSNFFNRINTFFIFYSKEIKKFIGKY